MNIQNIDIVNGDIVNAKEDIIIHQVNCKNAMGSGVARALFEKWYAVKSEYHNYCELCFSAGITSKDLLGHILPVKVSDKIIINCFSQENFGGDGKQYTDYNAIEKCFSKINELYPNNTIAIPYLYGCGLGGGNWDIVQSIIQKYFSNKATLYKLG